MANLRQIGPDRQDTECLGEEDGVEQVLVPALRRWTAAHGKIGCSTSRP
jgi:hypothetical protein